MDIDPYKIPAFQRKNKITPNKSPSLKMDIDPEIKILNRMKKDNASAIKPNRVTDIERHASYNTNYTKQVNQAIPETPIQDNQRIVTWRKMDCIGKVDQYFAKIDVIAIKLHKPLRTGEHIVFESPKGLFEQELTSMQINRQDIKTAKKGDDVGIKVKFEPLPGGSVYKVVAEGE
jgi:hypothetical protein